MKNDILFLRQFVKKLHYKIVRSVIKGEICKLSPKLHNANKAENN